MFISYLVVLKVPMPYKEAVPALRPRKAPKQIDVYRKPPPDRTRIEWLEYELQTRKHEKKGWLLNELKTHKVSTSGHQSSTMGACPVRLCLFGSRQAWHGESPRRYVCRLKGTQRGTRQDIWWQICEFEKNKPNGRT